MDEALLPDLVRRLQSWLSEAPLFKAVVGALFWVLGPLGDAHYALIGLVVLDTLTGVWAALREGRLRSAVMKVKGLSKLFLYFGALLLAGLVDRALSLGATSLTLGLLVATEALSVVENLRRINPKLSLWERLEGVLRKRS